MCSARMWPSASRLGLCDQESSTRVARVQGPCGPEGGGWYRLTWLAGCQPPGSVPTLTFWASCGQKREVGTDGRGWHAANPQVLCRPPLSGTAAARNERLVQTEAVGGVEAVVAPGVGDQKGEVGTGRRGWHAANSQILCTPPLSGTAWQPETGGWYGRTWLPTPTFCDLDPAAGGLRRHHVSARPLSQSRRDPIREADATVRRIQAATIHQPRSRSAPANDCRTPTSDDGKGKAVSFGLLPDWARA